MVQLELGSGGFDVEFISFVGQLLGGYLGGAVAVFVEDAFGEDAEEHVAIDFLGWRGCWWVRSRTFWQAVASDLACGGNNDVVVVFFASFGERGLIGNGFDFEIFVIAHELEADLLFGVDRF